MAADLQDPDLSMPCCLFTFHRADAGQGRFPGFDPLSAPPGGDRWIVFPTGHNRGILAGLFIGRIAAGPQPAANSQSS